MKQPKIPGIYMVRNKVNGKIYIGQSKNILHRFRQYYWESMNLPSNDSRPISEAITKYGYNQFEFLVIAAGDKYADTHKRLKAEMHYINKYGAQNPDIGYNTTSGGESGPESPRQQKMIERLRRAKPLFQYDIDSKGVMYYLSGANAVAKFYKTDKAITSHALSRGDVFMNKFYLIPAICVDRYKIVDRKILKRDECLAKHNHQKNKHTQLAINNYERYMKAVHYIDIIAQEFGFPLDHDIVDIHV